MQNTISQLDLPGVKKVRSGKVREIFSVAPNHVHGVVAAPDGRRIYFGLNTVETDVWLMSRE